MPSISLILFSLGGILLVGLFTGMLGQRTLLPRVTLLLLFGLLPGCIAAATMDTVLASGCKGPFADSLLAIVALDDAWGLILFSLDIAVVTSMQGIADTGEVLQLVLHEIGGAVSLGVAIGLPAAFLTGRTGRECPC